MSKKQEKGLIWKAVQWFSRIAVVVALLLMILPLMQCKSTPPPVKVNRYAPEAPPKPPPPPPAKKKKKEEQKKKAEKPKQARMVAPIEIPGEVEGIVGGVQLGAEGGVAGGILGSPGPAGNSAAPPPPRKHYSSHPAKMLPPNVALKARLSQKGVRYLMRSGGGFNTREFNTEEYAPINENRFLEVMGNPLSTFSIDVDTGAYSNARRFLNDGHLPPKDAVRLEEMINYFQYDYPGPKGKVPFSIHAELSQCPWEPSHRLMHIGIQGKRMNKHVLPPSNLVFLLDVSGSMSPANKLPLLKASFRMLVRRLSPEDRVAIVVYAGSAGLVLDSTPGVDKEKIMQALDLLQSGGSTAGGAGIHLAYKVAEENFIKGGNNRIILATDGDFNVGVSDTAALVRLVEEKRKKGVFLTTLGFGSGNYKDSRLEQLANKGNGIYYYIDNIHEGRKVFVHNMKGTLFTIAKDVKIQVEFNPAKVASYRLLGYENRMLKKEDFADDTKDAGELGAGHTVTALYEVVPKGAEKEESDSGSLVFQENRIKTDAFKTSDFALVKLRYKKPDGDVSKLITRRLKWKSGKGSENLRFSASVALFGMLLRNSKYSGKGTYNDVLTLARGSMGKDAHGYRAEFIRLVNIAKELK